MGILLPKQPVSESVDHHPVVFSFTLPSPPPLHNHLKMNQWRGDLFLHNEEMLNKTVWRTFLFTTHPGRRGSKNLAPSASSPSISRVDVLLGLVFCLRRTPWK